MQQIPKKEYGYFLDGSLKTEKIRKKEYDWSRRTPR